MSSMAEAYTRIYVNTCLDNKVKVLSDVISGGKCDGIVYNQNRSLKQLIFKKYLQEANEHYIYYS